MLNKRIVGKSKNRAWLLYLLFLIVIVIWILSGLFIVSTSKLSGWTERGTFGDMFGAINALFSGLAFAGVIYAIYLQTKELSLQREELTQTHEELRKSTLAQQKQQEALDLQARLLALSTLLSIEIAEYQRYEPGQIGASIQRDRIKQIQDQLQELLKTSSKGTQG